jgi:hypothetical protein
MTLVILLRQETGLFWLTAEGCRSLLEGVVWKGSYRCCCLLCSST